MDAKPTTLAPLQDDVAPASSHVPPRAGNDEDVQHTADTPPTPDDAASLEHFVKQLATLSDHASMDRIVAVQQHMYAWAGCAQRMATPNQPTACRAWCKAVNALRSCTPPLGAALTIRAKNWTVVQNSCLCCGRI